MRVAPINTTKGLTKKKLKGVHIQGTEGRVLSYAKCCYPIPGDSIIGHISPGKGIVVHRQSCMGIKHTKRINEQNIDLMWSENIDDLLVQMKEDISAVKNLTKSCFTHAHNSRFVYFQGLATALAHSPRLGGCLSE